MFVLLFFLLMCSGGVFSSCKDKCRDKHAVYKKCPSPCPLTCAEPFPNRVCTKMCAEYGCECAPGYILSEIGGKCIQPANCPEPICEEGQCYVINDTCCVKTCANRGAPTGGCKPFTGCKCQGDTVRQYANATGPCVAEEDCPCTDPNASPQNCPSSCQPTCEEPKPGICTDDCLPSGCVCNPGYILDKKGGECILISECSDNQSCNGDQNATIAECPNPCPATCAEPDTSDKPCILICLPTGCDCKPGFVLTEIGGECIKLEDCPGQNECSDPNASPQECPRSCQPHCSVPDTTGLTCNDECLQSGCVCNYGYILDEEDGKCIPISDCPVGICNGDQNATIRECPSPCPATCAEPDVSNKPCPAICLPPGCECNPGYVLSELGGQCIDLKDCPAQQTCSDPNASPQDCPRSCQPTCKQPDTSGLICTANCLPSGCVCNPGYILNKTGGKCIEITKCPANQPCNGDRNATIAECPNPCPDTCADPNASERPCIEICLPPGCDCRPGYVLTEDGGMCIKPEDCPVQPQCSDPNASPQECPRSCQPTCKQPDTSELICADYCLPSGCVCNPGYILNKPDGKCIKISKCSRHKPCNGDRNATIAECPNPCPDTCADPNASERPCIDICLPPGCDCRPGYVLTEDDGICIKPEDCPVQQQCSDPNASPQECPRSCQPTCKQPDTSELICADYCLPSGCVCNPGYILNKPDGKCIKISKCSRNQSCNGDRNATIAECPNPCPDTCSDPNASERPCIDICLPPGCDCRPGYVLTEDDGICIKPEDCPVQPQCSDPNASPQECPRSCQPTCKQPDTSELICTDVCLPSGCVCNPGYILNKPDGKCIKISKCSRNQSCNGDRNATIAECPNPCPDTCSDPNASERPCIDICLPPGCDCRPGYVLTEDDGICIKPEDCPVQPQCSDPNASPQECPRSCQPTCKQPDTSELICTDVCLPSGCVCNPGYILNKPDGKCIKISKCSRNQSCNGDRNATIAECPNPCPDTCSDPNASERPCIDICLPPGCDCRPGYVLTEDDGICIKPEDCPVQPQCSDPNASPQECPRSCQPTCKQPDTSELICTDVCLPSGCVCNPGYILNKPDGKCIKISKCSRNQSCNGDRNATIAACPNPCPDTCSDPNASDGPCIDICLPLGCNCRPGYVFTEDDGMCIKPEDCPVQQQCSDPNASPQECPRSCQPTCKQPDTSELICTAVCLPSGCVCNPGYILNKPEGKCIEISKCPANKPCNGDRNATIAECPNPCPNTCADPNASDRPCIEICLPPGCDCRPGYVLTEDRGMCIKPEDCSAQQICSDPNASPQECPRSCQPTCEQPDTSRLPCTANCLPSGCVCNPGYILNKPGGKCIKISKCPANQSCNGDRNATIQECPNPCPNTCADRNASDGPCILVCLPTGCDCKPGYLLTEKGGQCILPDDCPEDVGCNGDPNAIPNDCPSSCPPTCALQDTSNIDCIAACDPSGCVCKPGYILSETGGICIKPEECPVVGCKGDPNAMPQECPFPCPPTCSQPDTSGRPCIDQCDPSGCVCNDGYILNEIGGKCVKPEQCPDGIPICPTNKTFVYCRAGCPTDDCPEDDNRDMYACDQPYPCPAGCACKKGYLLLRNEKCILSSECPAVECTRPSEIWNPDLKNCKLEYCTNVGGDCFNGPKCACEPGYYRNASEICVPASECFSECNGDPNASPDDCPSPCAPTCAHPDTTDLQCIAECESGCVCNPGYILSEEGGICIKSEDCPECQGDPHAVFEECPYACPATCEEPDDTGMGCIQACDPPGCVCRPGYILTRNGGSCVLPEDCPGGTPSCGANKTFVTCTIRCERNYCPQSDSREIEDCSMPYPCTAGCVCNSGYLMLSPDDPTCVCASECPQADCTRPNEVWDPSPSHCLHLERCDGKDLPCPSTCPGSPRCVCEPGYYRDENDVCIPKSECPTRLECGYNEMEVKCRKICPPQNCEIAYTDYACDPLYRDICEPGCDCLPNHLRNGSGICILNDDCPYPTSPICGVNEIARDCRRICPPQTCFSRFALILCRENILCEPGCDCVPNYLRNSEGICIPAEDCDLPTPLECGFNEMAVGCRTICPPQNCEIPYTDYACDPYRGICEPGCDCLPNHLRNGSGICILNDDCPYPTSPICGVNEIARDCRRICPPQTCFSRRALILCRENIPCEPGCDCVPNYLRNSDGICIPAKDCDLPETCTIPDECIRTCAVPNPPNCPYEPAETNLDGCECMYGYILSEIGGVCIRIEDCPTNLTCSGDPHARPKFCPLPCPSTCNTPDASPCKRMCEPIGCECEPGYLFSQEDGLCILPDECPGGNPCGVNEEFRPCKDNCPQNYCPVDDNSDRVVCDPLPTCLSGCACRLNYRRLSYENDTCIVSSDCPPVNCTRPDEVWSRCPNDCYSGYCYDRENENVTCYTFVLNCQPKCICKTNTYRNASGICVPASECPPLCPIPDECIRTCASPNPPGCSYTPAEANIDGCQCMEGYILSEVGGKCIRIEDCPCSSGCNGDPNARPKICPAPCPSTCDSPDAIPCRRRCDPIGCECKPGYLLQDGQCILPTECPGGNPCGANGTFVPCKNECSTDYCPVDDSRDIVACDPRPTCLSGCICKLNHRRLSLEDRRCIMSSDCPPVDCTRPKEKWSDCPSACLAEGCDRVNDQPTTCNTLVQNCQPRCICKKNYFRNASDICVHKSKC